MLQGHFQIMFNPKVCPLFQSKLHPFWRLMYSQGCWSYIVGGISTPFFIALPIITVWIGVFPIVISRELALSLTIYGVASNLLQYYVRKPSQYAPSCHTITVDSSLVKILTWPVKLAGRT